MRGGQLRVPDMDKHGDWHGDFQLLSDPSLQQRRSPGTSPEWLCQRTLCFHPDCPPSRFGLPPLRFILGRTSITPKPKPHWPVPSFYPCHNRLRYETGGTQSSAHLSFEITRKSGPVSALSNDCDLFQPVFFIYRHPKKKMV